MRTVQNKGEKRTKEEKRRKIRLIRFDQNLLNSLDFRPDWGKIADAQAIYAELVARATREYMPPIRMAIAVSAAGESDLAVAHAREAFEIRDPWVITAKYCDCRQFLRLRQDPRFNEIVSRSGLK